MSTSATNRTTLGVLGVALTTAGTLGLILSWGGFGQSRARQPLIPDTWRAFVSDNPWLWWAVAIGGLLLAIIGVRWLLIQFATDRASHLEIDPASKEGRTVVHAGALTSAVSEDVSTIPGVIDASATLTEQPHRLHIRVDLADRADLSAIRRALSEQTIPRARRSTGMHDLPVQIQLRPSQGRSRDTLR